MQVHEIQSGLIVRYTDPEGAEFDAVVEIVKDDRVVIVYQRPIWQGSVVTDRIEDGLEIVTAESLSIPR